MKIATRLGLYSSLFVMLMLTSGTPAQLPAEPPLTEILSNAAQQSKAYVEAFKNLLTDETKTFEIYDKIGKPKKRKVIVSSFIVYQFTRDQERLNEYRNVISVDGKKLDNADQRAQDFFEQIVKVADSQTELKRLENESLRFDPDIFISGLTLFQSLALSDELRPFFDYRIEGRESMNGRNVYVVSYRQTRETSNIRVNASGAEAAGKVVQSYDIDADKNVPMNGRLRGRLWIDGQTFQVWKEHRELTVQPEGFEQPVVAIENDFEFQPSEFGILTPRMISHTQYRIKVREKQAVKEAKVTFEYGKFSKPDVDVKSGDVKQP